MSEIKLSKLKTNAGQIEGLPKNPRFIKDERFALLCENLKKYPKFLEKRPIVIKSWSEPVVIAGNMRFLGLKHIGYKEVPSEWIKTADDFTQDELAAFTILDNVGFGETDFDIIANEWTDFPLDDWGLELPDFESIDESEPQDAEPQIDKAEELNKKWQTAEGQLWILGEHRLLIGDCTKKENIERLMKNDKADMVYTDPPYGMFLETDFDQMFSTDDSHRLTGKRFEKVVGDNEDFNPLLIKSIFNYFDKVGEIFIWGADYFSEFIPNRTEGSWVVWDKRCDENMDKVSGNTFELCWSKQKHKRLIARILWSGHHGMQKDDTKTRVHPTQKPTELAKWFFDNWGTKTKIVVDLFLGSGSTLIACEQTKKQCFGMELLPTYSAVILQRYFDATGKMPFLSDQ